MSKFYSVTEITWNDDDYEVTGDLPADFLAECWDEGDPESNVRAALTEAYDDCVPTSFKFEPMTDEEFYKLRPYRRGDKPLGEIMADMFEHLAGGVPDKKP